MRTLKVGDTVRPVNDGEAGVGAPVRLAWTKLRGTVIDAWKDGTEKYPEIRVQVRWHRRSPYPSIVPSDWLERV